MGDRINPTFWREYLRNTDEKPKTVKFLKNNLDILGLRDAKRILSIGPGRFLLR